MILSAARLLGMHPGLEAGLSSARERAGCDDLVLDLRWEAMAALAPIATSLRDAQRAAADGPARTRAIVSTLRHGGEPWPVIVCGGDVLSGRHRIVAFHLLGLGHVSVVRASRPPGATRRGVEAGTECR